jgi:hypothetical protein
LEPRSGVWNRSRELESGSWSLGVGVWEWDFEGDLESRAWKGLGWVSLGVDLEVGPGWRSLRVGPGREPESNFEVRPWK